MKAWYLVFLLPFLLVCCKKETPPVIPPDDPFTFDVRYDSVLICNPATTNIFLFYIDVYSGSIAKNRLECTIDGVPAGVTVAPAVLSVGQLQGGTFTFKVGDIPLGSYNLEFKINSTVYGLQAFRLRLKVVAPTDYAPLLAGTYDSCYDFCPPDLKFYQSEVRVVPDTPYLIKIGNFRNQGVGFQMRAWVSQSIRVPLQTVGAYKVWGSGTYTKDHEYYRINITDTVVNGLDTQYCTLHVEH